MFNLNNYILNEAFTSSILQNDILYEPSGFFKYVKIIKPDLLHKLTQTNHYKIFRHNVYVDALQLQNKLLQCLKQIFNLNENHFHTSYFAELNSNSFKDILSPKTDDKNLLSKSYKKLSDAELIKINKAYLTAYDEYQKKIKNLFNRPDGEILVSIFNKQIPSSYNAKLQFDLMSVTDTNLKRYSFNDIKNDKDAFLSWYKKDHIVLFVFNKNGYLLGVVHSGQLILKNTLIENSKDGEITEAPKFEKLKKLYNEYSIKSTSENNIIRTQCNNSNKILYWPVIYVEPTDNVFENTELLKYIGNEFSLESYLLTRNSYEKSKAIGDIKSSASNLRKMLTWGFDKDDYIIAYVPNKALSYNDYYHNDYDQRKNELFTKERKQNFETSIVQQYYKKRYNSLFQIMPYRIGDYTQTVTIYNEYTQKYEIKRITSYDRDAEKIYNIAFSNNIDVYVTACREALEQKVKVFKDFKKSAAYIVQYKDLIYSNQKTLSKFIKQTEALSKRIRILLQSGIPADDMNNLRIILYGGKNHNETSNYIKLFPDLTATNEYIYGLQNLINNAISILASGSQLYMNIINNLEQYKASTQSLNNPKYNFDASPYQKTNFDEKSALNRLQSSLSSAQELIQQQTNKLFFNDIQELINKTEEILKKYDE